MPPYFISRPVYRGCPRQFVLDANTGYGEGQMTESHEPLMAAVCPGAEAMEIEGVVHCPVDGCGQQLSSSSHLQMHIVRRHRDQRLQGAGQRKVFYCPVEGCERALGQDKPFPRMGQLKQHYQTVHGTKEFACGRCGKTFGLRDVCSRHEAECGRNFVCGTCGEEFRSKNALYQHAKRKQHSLPEGSQPRGSKEGSQPRGSKQKTADPDQLLPPIVITIRQVIELPREVSPCLLQPPQQKETAVQTLDDSSHYMGDPPQSAPQSALGLPAVPITSAVPTTSHAVQAGIFPYLASTGAQTDPDLTDLATQTDFSDFADQFLSFGTQTTTAGTITQGCQTQPNANTQGCQTQLDANMQGCQTQLDANTQDWQTQSGANSCEFGTQTPSSSANTQDLATAFSMVSVDFGTQTAAVTSCSTSIAAVDCDFMMEQALEHLLPPECMDFGTQTLESSLVDVLPCLDLGLQPLLQSETRDQESQTL